MKKKISILLVITLILSTLNIGQIFAETGYAETAYVEKIYTVNADFAEGTLTNLTSKQPDQLQIDDTTRPFGFIWVAVSSKGTVVKLDTHTGKILGEYCTSPDGQPKNPSRTTVDKNGSVWVSNRDGNSVTRICLPESGLWIDKNGNGKCDTSVGLNDVRPWTNDNSADTNGGVNTAQDECIINYIRVSSSGTRHVSVDANNDVWVSGTGGRIFDLIDGNTGKIKRSEGPVGFGGYGGLIDKNGVIWSSNWFLRWDTSKPLSGENGTNWTGYYHDSYGLTIDKYGNVWNTSFGGNTIRKYAPNGTLLGIYGHGAYYSQGCVADPNGDIWVAHSMYDASVGHIKNDGTFVGIVPVETGPTGVAVDSEGKIWTTNYNSGTVSRIDPTKGPIGNDGVTHVGAVDYTSVYLGGNLYNYSDMTGSTLVGAPNLGTWSTVYDSNIENLRWGKINWNSKVTEDGTITVSVQSSNDGINFSEASNVSNESIMDVPQGRYLKVTVTFMRSGSGVSPVLYDLTIRSYNRQPVLDPVGNKATDENSPLQFRLSASDPDNDILRFSAVNLPQGASLDPVTGVFTWIPTYEQSGEYRNIKFVVSDGSGSDSEEISIAVNNVNRPPALDAIGDKTVNEAQTLKFQINASDPDGDVLTYSVEGLPQGAGFDPLSRTFSWTPTYEQCGKYEITFNVSDGKLSDSEKIYITVIDVNRPPVVTGAKPSTICIWPPNSKFVAINILGLTDPDGDKVNAKIIRITSDEPTAAMLGAAGKKHAPDAYGIGTGVANVRSERSGTSNGRVYEITFAATDGRGAETIGSVKVCVPHDQSVVDPGAIDDGQKYDATDGEAAWDGTVFEVFSKKYVKEKGKPQTAIDRFTLSGDSYGILKIQNGENGKNKVSSAVITVNGKQVAGPSNLNQNVDFIQSDIQLGKENTIQVDLNSSPGSFIKVSVECRDFSNNSPLITSIPITTAKPGAAYSYDVEATDANGDKLIYSLVAAPTGMSINQETGLISWIPSVTQGGRYNVTVRVTDTKGGTADQSYTIVVAETANSNPAITSAPITNGKEGIAYSYDVEAADADGDRLSYSLMISPPGMNINADSGLISWTPSGTQAGRYSVAVRVIDGRGGIAQQSYTIDVAEAINNSPVIISSPVTVGKEGATYSYNVEATDGDNDRLAYSLITAPGGMTINADSGLISWTPSGIQAGRYSVAVKVTDGRGGTTEQSYTVDVAEAVNTAPVIISSPITTGKEWAAYAYDAEATDGDSDRLVYSLVTAPTGMTINSASGLISWTPSAIQAGKHDVAVRVIDGRGGAAEQSYTIAVEEAVNNSPEITSSPVTAGKEGVAYSYDAEATDADNDKLIYSLVAAPAGMTINPDSGLISWMPSGTQAGRHNVTVRADDGRGGTAEQSYTIDVSEALNNSPVIISNPVTTGSEGTAYSYDVEAADVDGDRLIYSLVTAPTGMTINPDTGMISWIPSAAQAGKYNVTVKVTDGRGGTAGQSYTIDIADAVNINPVITSAPITAGMAATVYTYDVEATDADNDKLVYSLTTAPAGMTINADSGLISWIPSRTQTGRHNVTVKAADGRGGAVEQSYTVDVAQASNSNPVIISNPITTGKGGTAYSYDVEAADVDGDSLTYSLATALEGMTINPGSGLISWTPSVTQTGRYNVTVRVIDGKGGTAEQSYTIDVADASNNNPEITSAPIKAGKVGTAYSYNVEATDADGDRLIYSLTTAPAGMTINAADGLISWMPSNEQSGENNVAVEVRDSKGGRATQAFSIMVGGGTVQADTERPVVKLTVSGDTANTGTPITITVAASDNVGIASKTLTINGNLITLDAAGKAVYTSAAPGVFKLEATAFDAARNKGYDAAEITFIMAGDTAAPTVTISTPLDNMKVSQPVDIIGTVGDDIKIIGYKLEYSVKDENEYVIFASGTSPVTNGVLGTLDPTMMENGLYDIRLTVEDAGGNISTADAACQVVGDIKVGNFTIGFTDLTIPVSGISLDINRNYDSRDKSNGDFGIGWTLEMTDIKLSESGELYTGWTQASTGGLLPTYKLLETEPHYITVTYPDGKTDEFQMVLSPSSSPLVPIECVTVSFVARPGTTSRLEALTDNECMLSALMGDFELLSSDMGCYDPDRYKLTTKDGTVMIISRSGGIESITDSNGNKVTITANGIIHSAGKSVTFTRDDRGRITAITDPMGNTIRYEYDYYGDLVKVTDAAGNETKFIYNSTHGIVDIIDPRGIRPIRNEYDDQGRLAAHIDSEGNRIEYTHNIDGRQEIVKDRLGNIIVITYDDRGNVLQKTDALGNTISYTYDSRGNQLTKTNALGNTETFAYDEQGNLLSETDALGNKTEYTYSSEGRLLTQKDFMGNTITNSYNSNGNLMSRTYDDGKTVYYTYDSMGNITSIKDPSGKVTNYTYNSSGNMTGISCPDGTTVTYTYDANGNQTGMTITKGGSVTKTERIYDSMNREIETVDASGNSTKTEYNAIGKKSAEIDALGSRTEYQYDEFGNLICVKYPDGTEDRYTYDAESRNITATDRAGRTTTYIYDKLGRVIKTIYPDGSFTTVQYDAIGNIISKTDELGNTTRYAYDAAYNNISVTDALGNVTTYEYDKNGLQVAMIDAKGNVTRYEYDANGQKTKTIFADGTYTTTIYDSMGRKTTETDQAGKPTAFEYDPSGSLAKVTDPLNNSTAYTYDTEGSLISQTDPNGHTTRFEYDKLGRKTKRILPTGAAEVYTYDGAGNLTAHTDFNGKTIRFEYDTNGQMVKKIYPDGKTESYTYTATGQRLTVKDERGTTAYEYDKRDRLTRQINPDGTIISYTYDAAGNRTSVTVPSGTTLYTYDALNRLSTVKDPQGKVTTYTYDAVGNRTKVEYPNGTVTEYTYDKLNRLIKLVNLKAGGEVLSSYEYTLGPSGNRLKVTENSGRTIEYTYDDTYRLIREDVKEPSGAVHFIAYTYDASGNRLTKNDNGAETDYTYDANDRLMSEGGNTYTYDNNGNMLSKTGAAENSVYIYNYSNQLVKAVTTNNSGTSSVEYGYDTDGIRVRKLVDGTKTSIYLTDKNMIYAQVLEEWDGSGKLEASYIYGDDLISQYRASGKSYYHYDGLGSTRMLTNEAGQVTDTYTYDAFGILTAKTGATQNDYLFTGEQYDPNIGFYYLRARYMDPATGRFVTMDPYEGDIYSPQSLHKYTYCSNNPISFVDYLGLQSAAVKGTYIHQGIHTLYPGAKWPLNAPIPYSARILKPDIVDPGLKDVYEIKPLSLSAVFGVGQLTLYLTVMNTVGIMNPGLGTGWKRGGWIPNAGPYTAPVIGTQYIIVGNLKGLILYWFPDTDINNNIWDKINRKIQEYRNQGLYMEQLAYELTAIVLASVASRGAMVVGVAAKAYMVNLMSQLPTAFYLETKGAY